MIRLQNVGTFLKTVLPGTGLTASLSPFERLACRLPGHIKDQKIRIYKADKTIQVC